MVTYVEAARRLPDDERDEALSILRKLQFGNNFTRRFAANVEADFRVPDRVWEDIFSEIPGLGSISDDEAGANAVAEKFRDIFRRHLRQVPDTFSIESRQPVGPEIAGLAPEAFGRLASLKQLAGLWQWAAPATAKPRSAATLTYDQSLALIYAMSSPAGLDMQRKRGMLPDLPLGRFIMWSTFEDKRKGPDPFQPRTGKLSDLVSHLGLDSIILFDRDPRDLNDPSLPPCFCVLLAYQVPANGAVHVPTVVEAYAGPGRMNYYFEVWRHEVSAGRDWVPRTMGSPMDENSGHPEVVHPVVFGGQLLSSLQIEQAT